MASAATCSASRSGAANSRSRSSRSDGGLFPRWRDAKTLEYGSGQRYYVRHMDTGRTDTIRSSSSVPRDVPTGSVALTNARIVTLDQRKVIERGTIVVKGSRITCVGACSTSGVDRVINASGKTIIPGFVDMHAHHYREWRGMRPRHDFEQAIYLAYGVTTTLDPSMYSPEHVPDGGADRGRRDDRTARLQHRRQHHGRRRGARERDRQPGRRLADGAARWPIGARCRSSSTRSRGATSVSGWPRRRARSVSTRRPRAATSWKTWASSWTARRAGSTRSAKLPMYADGAKFFGKAGATYSPTLVRRGSERLEHRVLVRRERRVEGSEAASLVPVARAGSADARALAAPETDYSYPLVAQAMADIIAEGGYGAIGCAWRAPRPRVALGGVDGRERVGNMGALEVASLHGARFLGADKDLGSIEVGKLADLMVLTRIRSRTSGTRVDIEVRDEGREAVRCDVARRGLAEGGAVRAVLLGERRRAAAEHEVDRRRSTSRRSRKSAGVILRAPERRLRRVSLSAASKRSAT